jgi:hypothetical protein
MSVVIEFEDVNLYSHWASALINNDWSGLSDDDSSELRVALSQLGIDEYQFVGISEDTFFGEPDCSGLPGDLATYTYRVV